MPITRLNFDRLPYLGAFASATDKVALLPRRFATPEDVVADTLGVSVVRAGVEGSPLLGILVAGNSRCILVSEAFEFDAEGPLLELGIRVARIPGRHTAIGNAILANDKGALVNPELPDRVLKLIGEALGVPVARGTIAGLKNVGAAAVATNKGVLAHPSITEEELELLERTLRVPADIGTACGGVEYVGICMIANSNGALVGEPTTGPELGRVESALGFI